MRKRVVLIVAAVIGLLLLVGAGAVYAYDRSNAEEIGKGVKVSGVDVSGLTPDESRAKLRSAVLEPLERSREGGILERAWRGIRGQPVNADLELDVTYSKASISRLVERVS